MGRLSGFSFRPAKAGAFAELPFSAEKSVGATGAPLHRSDADEALSEAFLSGSDEAFLRLYAKYEHSLFYYCKRMLHNDAAAEDAFQEIWTRIYEFRGRKNAAITHFRGLLFHSARNLCLNILQSESHEESIDDRPNVDESAEFMLAESMSDESSGREIQALMVRGLAKLPFEQRETFVLHEYSGFTYGEIAEMMGVPEQNVKVRAHRARARLRKFISSWLGLGEEDEPGNFI